MDIGVGGGVIRFPGDTRPLQEMYKWCVEYSAMAEQNGFDFIWVGEQHFAPNQWNPSSLPILGAFAARTSKIRIGTNVIVIPYHNPLRLAEDVATVDLLSNGRMDFVVGSGSVKDEPVQNPFPLWIAASGPKTIARAGREGYHFQAPRIDNLGAPWESYSEGVRESGRNPDDFNCQIMSSIVAEETWGEQKAAVLKQRIAGFRAFYESRPLVYSSAVLDMHPAFSPIAGTPDQVLKALEPKLKGSKVTHLQVGLPDPRAMAFFAKEIAPTLRKWGRNPGEGDRSHRRALMHGRD